jgi:glycosyltransferase involved in cell wall biosynthesis
MSSQSKLRVVIAAFNCDGTDVGESFSTFKWVSSLADRHHVTLLTSRGLNRPSVVPQLPRVEVVEWDDLPIFSRFERFNSIAKPGYFGFYLSARAWLRSAMRQGRQFDLGHQIGPLAVRYYPVFTGLPIPFVFGPVGGSVEAPPEFASELKASSWYTRLRRWDRWRLRHDRFLRRGLLQAQVIVGVAPYVEQLLKDLPPRRFEVMSEIGVSALPAEHFHAVSPPGQLRLLYVGRVTRSKGVRDAVRAMIELPDLQGVTLDVVGDGDDLARCKQEAAQIKGTGRIRFHGRVHRSKVEEFYSNSDVFLFPSLRECTGNVTVEAMSHGLPLIVAYAGGPAYTVTDECGCRIPPSNLTQFPRDLASAVRKLATDPSTVRRMGIAARARVAGFYLWEQKANWMSQLYAEVAQNRGSQNSELNDAGRPACLISPANNCG